MPEDDLDPNPNPGGAPPPPPVATTPATPPVARPPAAPGPDDDDDSHRRAISDIRIRERRKALKDNWGTDDPVQIEAIKAKQAEEKAERERRDQELEALRLEKTERERSQLSEVEKLKLDLTAANDKVAALERERDAAKQEVFTERQNSLVGLAAARLRVRSKFLRMVRADLGSHYLALSSIEKKRFDEKALDRWMKGYIKENPEIVEVDATPTPVVTDPPAPRAPAPPVRRPVGGPPARPGARPTSVSTPRHGTNAAGKTTKPGQPNSMNAQELRDYQKTLGYRGTG